MIVRLEENSSQKEIELLIKYTKMNQEVKRLEKLIRSAEKTVKCKMGEKELWVKVSDIYYIESVDKKTYLYCEKEVLCSEFRLYQLAAELVENDFVQVSKFCILNLKVLNSIRPLLNSRLEATLSNGDRINITRKYLSSIRGRLQER